MLRISLARRLLHQLLVAYSKKLTAPAARCVQQEAYCTSCSLRIARSLLHQLPVAYSFSEKLTAPAASCVQLWREAYCTSCLLRIALERNLLHQLPVAYMRKGSKKPVELSFNTSKEKENIDIPEPFPFNSKFYDTKHFLRSDINAQYSIANGGHDCYEIFYSLIALPAQYVVKISLWHTLQLME